MRWLLVFFAIFSCATAAQAKEELSFAPVGEWVETVEPPGKQTDVTRGSGVAFRLFDLQTRFEEEGQRTFTRSVYRVNAPEALTAAGNLAVIWDPATQEMIVNHVLIRRGDEVIDVLRGGQKFTILRREGNLEQAMVNGILTGSLPIAGLRVGDTVDVATTIIDRDPALAGHSEVFLPIIGGTAYDRLHILQSWPKDRAIRWKNGDGLPEAKLFEKDGRQVLKIDATAFVSPALPDKVPGRFLELGAIQLSDFQDWRAVSALFAPAYEEAATLSAQSQLRTEAARIAATHHTPKARAEAALALVQSEVRYLYDGTGLGGYIPVSADSVWASRYGDCKGKTVLLLALLHELGIRAEPALVSATRGNGLDQSLPMPMRFDHVIVKATIDGRTYWLDGTRLGDRELDRIAVPEFEWALPLATAGASLERLPAADPGRPQMETVLELDAREGLSVPAKVKGEITFRGDGAAGIEMALNLISDADRDKALRQFWSDRHDWIDVQTADYRFDPRTGEARLSMNGTAGMDWDLFGDDAKRRYEADGARLGQNLAPERKEGPYSGLPVAIGAEYSITRETILLPNEGRGFFVEGADIDATIGEARYRRTASISDGRFEMEAVTRIRGGEVSLAEAKANDEESDEVFAKRLFIRVPHHYALTEAERSAIRSGAEDSSEPGAQVQLALMAALEGDFDETLKQLNEAIEQEPTAMLLALRSDIYRQKGDTTRADADLDTALALDPNDPMALWTRANVLVEAGKADEATILLDRMILVQPRYADAYALRARLRQQKGNAAGALADLDIALRIQPENLLTRIQRVSLLSGRGENEKALADADALLKLFPDSATGHALRGNVLGLLDRGEEASAALARSLSIEPTADAYLTRFTFALSGSPEARLDDLIAAIDLDPTRGASSTRLKEILGLEGAYDRILAAYSRGRGKAPDDLITQAVLEVKEAAGRHEEVLESLDRRVRREPKSATMLNSRCWYRATHNLELEKALADCNASVAIRAYTANLDSRALVHLRRGDFAKAVGDYDAALAQRPDHAPSLYGRGLAKLAMGNRKEGEADLEAARALDRSIDEMFADFGMKPTAMASTAGD